MALYFYHAFSKDGKKVQGQVDAPSLPAAKDQISKLGLFPISITPGTHESKIPWWKKITTRGVSIKDKVLFTKQLAILLRSGVPLLQALELLVDHFEGPLHTIIIAVKDDIKEGRSFADALKKYPKTFDNIYVQLVRAGEASGNLEMILERLTSFIERRAAIAKKVKSALRMPMIQLGVALIVVVILMTQVVPTMAESFSGMGGELPGTTRVLIAISDFMTNYYLFVLIFLIIVGVAAKFWAKTAQGARTLDKIRLRIPVVKYFARMNAVVQFSYTLGMLIEGGVNLAEALDIVVSIIDNRILADTLREARDKIVKQGKITQYLKQTNIFPPIAIYLIKTGEETGKLGEMLLTVARNYEEELSDYADALSARLGPLLLIVMAVLVGFIVISIASPMIEMVNLAGEGL
jgi:type IV pilus assembly protein PilC